MGIVPDYIASYEEARKNVNESMFDFKAIREHGIPVIGSKMSKEWLNEKLNGGLKRFIDYPSGHCTNVGMFGCMFARKSLLVDKIILIGMNCWSNTQAYPFLNWYVEWRKFINECNPNTIINCTEGGILYFERVIPADFETLVISSG